MKTKKRNMLVTRDTTAFIASAAAFLSPLLIGHPAEAVGIIVNSMLIFAALRLGTLRAVPVIVLPVLGVLARAAIIGPFAPFLPIAAALALTGNAVLVIIIRMISDDRTLGVATGIVAKTALMSSASAALAGMGALPRPALATMGFFQLYTAAAGGAIVLLAEECWRRYHSG